MAGATIDMAELRELCWAEQAGELSPEAAARLEQLVTGSSAACNYYTHYVSFCAHLEWSATPCDEVCDRVVGKVEQAPSPAALPMFSFLGDSVHGAVATVPQGWLLAYLIATVTFGVGLLIGSLIPVSSSEQVAKSVPSANESIAGPEMQSVGRITGMIDCRWVDPDSAAVGYAAVPFGRRYALASGLMEITYDTGARVILQGPVTYEIDSRHGGYLSAGKLTARLETEAIKAAERQIAESQSPISSPSLATITLHYSLSDSHRHCDRPRHRVWGGGGANRGDIRQRLPRRHRSAINRRQRPTQPSHSAERKRIGARREG